MSELPREWLVGRTKVREFYDRLVKDFVAVPESLRAKVEAHAARIEAKLQPDDELWEWRNEGGPFASAGGMAILRGGEVVEWWSEWRS